MQSEVLTLKKGASFDKNLRAFTALGALFVCTASTLATHQFLISHWLVLFYLGCAVVVSGTAISIVKKSLKRMGYVSGDKNEDLKHKVELNQFNFVGKRLEG